MLEVRKEYKFVLNDHELQKFLNALGISIKVLFKQRFINSLYMDTQNYKLFYDSEINDVDKFKVRYRQYNNDGPIYLETKFNNSTGRYKKSIKLDDIFEFKDVKQIFYKNLFLSPALFISYERNYYEFKNTRITLDKNLMFKSCKTRTQSTYSYKSLLNVVEYKILNNNVDIEKNFLRNPVSFSKYNYGLQKVYSLK